MLTVILDVNKRNLNSARDFKNSKIKTTGSANNVPYSQNLSPYNQISFKGAPKLPFSKSLNKSTESLIGYFSKCIKKMGKAGESAKEIGVQAAEGTGENVGRLSAAIKKPQVDDVAYKPLFRGADRESQRAYRLQPGSDELYEEYIKRRGFVSFDVWLQRKLQGAPFELEPGMPPEEVARIQLAETAKYR